LSHRRVAVRAALEGALVEVHLAVTALYADIAIFNGRGRVVAEPFAHRDARVVVVGAHEYKYRVDILAVFRFKFFALGYHLVHPVAVSPIDIRFDSEDVHEEVPVGVVGGLHLPLVGDGIAQECHSGTLPLALNLHLGRSRRAAKQQRRRYQ